MNRWLPVISVLISFVALVFVGLNLRHTRKRETETDWQEQIDDAIKPFLRLPDIVAELSANQLVLKKQMEVFWKGVRYGSAEALISPHTPELDDLLRRFQGDRPTLSRLELQRLRYLLREVRDDPEETTFRRKMANDVITLTRVEEIGCELRESLNEQDEQFSNDIRGLSRRLEH